MSQSQESSFQKETMMWQEASSELIADHKQNEPQKSDPFEIIYHARQKETEKHRKEFYLKRRRMIRKRRADQRQRVRLSQDIEYQRQKQDKIIDSLIDLSEPSDSRSSYDPSKFEANPGSEKPTVFLNKLTPFQFCG